MANKKTNENYFYRQQTKCLNCGDVLTDQFGKRIASAVFDNLLPNKVETIEYMPDGTLRTVWGRCDSCYEVSSRKRNLPDVKELKVKGKTK